MTKRDTTIQSYLALFKLDEKRREEARANAYKKQLRELAQYDSNLEENDGAQVVAAEDPEPLMDLIEKDVFNVVPVGSKAYSQLPVVDQARIYVHQVGPKISRNSLDYSNVPESKRKLKSTLNYAYADLIAKEKV